MSSFSPPIGVGIAATSNRNCLKSKRTFRRYIKPQLPEIEADFPDLQFIEVDRDEYMDVAVEWNIFGIPSLVVIEDGKELGRLVNKDRKTKEEIEAFLTSVQSA